MIVSSAKPQAAAPSRRCARNGAAFAVGLLCAMALVRLQGTPQKSDATIARFRENIIANNYAYPYGIQAADIDGDGDIDITSSDAEPSRNLYWYQNQGLGMFRRRIIKRDGGRFERHTIIDMNDDGKLDVVVVGNMQGHVYAFENPGGWMKAWKGITITNKAQGAYDVTVADFDGDGDKDVAASNYTVGNSFVWFEQQTETEWWFKRTIDAVEDTRMVHAIDLDKDGDMDLLGTGAAGGQVVWYENTGNPALYGWRKHFIEPAAAWARHGQAVDMDHDGDMDVVMAVALSDDWEMQGVVWYEQTESFRDKPWPRHAIGPGFSDPYEAVTADFDNDCDLDVVATSWRSPGKLAWFENTGDPKGQWIEHTLKDTWRSANQVIAADFNGDGWTDIAAVAERNNNELRWWRNEGKPGFRLRSAFTQDCEEKQRKKSPFDMLQDTWDDLTTETGDTFLPAPLSGSGNPAATGVVSGTTIIQP